MNLVHKVEPSPTGPDFLFWCDGCHCAHGIWTIQRNASNAIWTFNGNLEKPTVSPSIKIEYPAWEPPVTPENMDKWRANPWHQTKKTYICHCVINDGVINYGADSTHGLSGQTLPMTPFPQHQDV